MADITLSAQTVTTAYQIYKLEQDQRSSQKTDHHKEEIREREGEEEHVGFPCVNVPPEDILDQVLLSPLASLYDSMTTVSFLLDNK